MGGTEVREALAGHRLALVGGDAREAVIAHTLSGWGARVRTYAVEFTTLCPLPGFHRSASLEEALDGATALVLPLAGTDDHCQVYAPAWGEPVRLTTPSLGRLAAGARVLVGQARPALRELVTGAGLSLRELADDDELAILNAIPTAEGAIALAMDHLPVTLHGARAVVIGFGRTGSVLAPMLRGLGARVAVVARQPRGLALAQALGLEPVPFDGLPGALRDAVAVFNTVPAPVLGARELDALRGPAVVVDLASRPGGTDFDAARERGIAAILAPGLPGRRAPLTAGLNQARVIARALLHDTGGPPEPASTLAGAEKRGGETGHGT